CACCASVYALCAILWPWYAMESPTLTESLWQRCLLLIENRLSENDINLWLRPLEAEVTTAGLDLKAPNEVVRDHVEREFRNVIANALAELDSVPRRIRIIVGGGESRMPRPSAGAPRPAAIAHNLDPRHTFENFVKGKSNQ